MIKGIAFDLQFTLVYLEGFTLFKWFKLFNAGFRKVTEYLKDQNIEFDDRRLFRTLRRIRNKYFALTITRQQNYFSNDILKETFLKRSISLSQEQLNKCIRLYHSIEIPAWKPYPNLQTTIKTLAKEYQLAIITNATSWVNDETLRLQGILEFFPIRIANALKPRPEAFLKFKKMVNAEAHELVVVGDDIRADIEPAIRLGMKTIHAYRGYEYLMHHAEAQIKPDIRIEKLEDVIGAVERLA